MSQWKDQEGETVKGATRTKMAFRLPALPHDVLFRSVLNCSVVF